MCLFYKIVLYCSVSILNPVTCNMVSATWSPLDLELTFQPKETGTISPATTLK